MLKKVISGGQTGVDIAALKAAKQCGIATGGWMPKGYRTLNGNWPQYAEWYGVQEHSCWGYKERTWDNVRDADGTLRLAAKLNSAGEKCTLNAIKAHNKPYYDVDVNHYHPAIAVVEWIQKNNIYILNVAGNSEQTCPGIEQRVEGFLIQVFKQLTEGE